MIKLIKGEKLVIIASASVLFAVASVFNMNLLQRNNNESPSLNAVIVMAQAQSESWTNCTNCYAQGYYCHGVWTYKCLLGGTTCNVSGQMPC